MQRMDGQNKVGFWGDSLRCISGIYFGKDQYWVLLGEIQDDLVLSKHIQVPDLHKLLVDVFCAICKIGKGLGDL